MLSRDVMLAILPFAFNHEAQVYFSNETVSQTTVSTGLMKMFHLEHETVNVCQRNVARFVHVQCRFDKINEIFQGFGNWCHCDFRKMEALKANKFGRTYRTGTQGGSSSLCRRSYNFKKKSLSERTACENAT